ncbi:hypothetical protein GCM10010924_53530 [Rhizobium wenxiniae]|nr:hypothetical protein GCM10010924_53530 [Rhizobium wenxiniae]
MKARSNADHLNANEVHICMYIPLTYPSPENIFWGRPDVDAKGAFDGTRCGISEQS